MGVVAAAQVSRFIFKYRGYGVLFVAKSAPRQSTGFQPNKPHSGRSIRNEFSCFIIDGAAAMMILPTFHTPKVWPVSHLLLLAARPSKKNPHRSNGTHCSAPTSKNSTRTRPPFFDIFCRCAPTDTAAGFVGSVLASRSRAPVPLHHRRFRLPGKLHQGLLNAAHARTGSCACLKVLV